MANERKQIMLSPDALAAMRKTAEAYKKQGVDFGDVSSRYGMGPSRGMTFKEAPTEQGNTTGLYVESMRPSDTKMGMEERLSGIAYGESAFSPAPGVVEPATKTATRPTPLTPATVVADLAKDSATRDNDLLMKAVGGTGTYGLASSVAETVGKFKAAPAKGFGASSFLERQVNDRVQRFGSTPDPYKRFEPAGPLTRGAASRLAREARNKELDAKTDAVMRSVYREVNDPVKDYRTPWAMQVQQSRGVRYDMGGLMNSIKGAVSELLTGEVKDRTWYIGSEQEKADQAKAEKAFLARRARTEEAQRAYDARKRDGNKLPAKK